LEKEWTGLLLEDANVLRLIYTVAFLRLYNKKVRTCFAGQVRFDPRADRSGDAGWRGSSADARYRSKALSALRAVCGNLPHRRD